MEETFYLGKVAVHLIRKAVKHARLNVHPPLGQVSLIVPLGTRSEVARAYAITKLPWIKAQQERFAQQARETSHQFVGRETHFLWGRRYLLALEYAEAKPKVKLDHRRITLTVRPGSAPEVRSKVIHDWHKSLLHAVVPAYIAKWEAKLGVKVAAYFLQRMKTRWGSCNPKAGHIRLNTELVKKPKDLLEYVIVHEMLHLLEASHNQRFVSLLDQFYPNWREAKNELNDLPLGAERWDSLYDSKHRKGRAAK